MKLDWPDFSVGLGLALATLLTRIPFGSKFLYHWDSVNFALSLEKYDVGLHQPHPPGYFLYSMLGKLVSQVIGDANTSLVWISILSGVVSVIALFWLGTVLFNRQIGLIVALLGLTNPLHWFYNEIALSYALEFLLVILLAGLCYLQLTGNRRIWLWLAILLGVAGGVRQNDLVFLFPLWFISLYPLSWAQRAKSVAVLGVVVVTWITPMMALSGGLLDYLTALRAGGGLVASESSFMVPYELIKNGARLTIYLGYGLLLGALPLIWGVWSLISKVRVHLLDRRAWVFVLWIGPAGLFYLVVHVRQHGHIFVFLPAIFVLTALATVKLSQYLGGSGKAELLAGVFTIIMVSVNVMFFLLAPKTLFGSDRLPLQTPSRQTIAAQDRYLAARIDFVRNNFSPTDTIIISGSKDFRHPDYYLREYRSYAVYHDDYRVLDNFWEDGQQLPDDIQTLVLFTPDVEQELQVTGAHLYSVQAGADTISYFERTDQRPIFIARAVNVELN